MSIRGKASKYRGVYKCGRKWKSQIQVDGVQHYLGIFENEIQAAAKYNEAAAGLGRAENILDDESSYSSATTSRGNILLMDTIKRPETESHLLFPQLHGHGHTTKADSDSDSILQLLTTMDSADDNDGDDDDDEVYVGHRSPTTIHNTINHPVQVKECDDRIMVAKKITLGKLIQKISSILESVKQGIPARAGSKSSSNSLQWKQQGEFLSRKAFLWTTLEDFRLLTAEKMKLVEELL